MRLVFAHIAVTAALAIVATAGLLTLSAPALAETGPDPVPESRVCHATHGVGIAAQIGECTHAKNPADYGSGPGEIVIAVRP